MPSKHATDYRLNSEGSVLCTQWCVSDFSRPYKRVTIVPWCIGLASRGCCKVNRASIIYRSILSSIMRRMSAQVGCSAKWQFANEWMRNMRSRVSALARVMHIDRSWLLISVDIYANSSPQYWQCPLHCRLIATMQNILHAGRPTSVIISPPHYELIALLA